MEPLDQQLQKLAMHAKEASRILTRASAQTKDEVLQSLTILLEQAQEELLKVNSRDIHRAQQSGLSSPMVDRLTLTPARIAEMIQSVRTVQELKDPIGEVIKRWVQKDGLEISKVRVPIGVIGIIYESRPNVTIDSAALCFKAGNVVILRGGSEAIESNAFLANLFGQALEKHGLPASAATFVSSTDREAVRLLCNMERYIDLMIPRGGVGLIETVVKHARMPVIKHFQGICHIYVDSEANLEMAQNIVLNAKCQRPAACNAVETLLVDETVAAQFLPMAVSKLRQNGVRILGDKASARILNEKLEEPANWSYEYSDLVLAVKIVNGLEEATRHIEAYGSHHSDAIVTQNEKTAEKFLKEVDSATVYWNASTRFTDGGQFGFGAEIGISTDKIHARGPMGLEELTSYKYLVRGQGQVRK